MRTRTCPDAGSPGSGVSTPEVHQFRLTQADEALAQERQQSLDHGLCSEALQFAGQIPLDLALCYGNSITRHIYLQICC